ncbi:hypothetical protein [Gordonia sp. (in: high G+C Gram-positive bacteria)]|uniref:hypothetical protein n=1 Tax=Gordonia sp. (in: high G+C Gram-positive bacteria) TaxID=84139 RepID=UPI0039E6DD1F
MKTPDTRAALRHYDLARDPVDHGLDPVLPAEPGPVHALDLEPDRVYRRHAHLDNNRSVVFSEWSGTYTALCERIVRVILPMPFDTADPDVCPQCQRWAELRIADPAEFKRQRREWMNEKLQRDEEQENITEWKRRGHNTTA